MMNYHIGEIWYAKFPLEENLSKYIERPVIIAAINLPNLVVIKITSHDPRKTDPYDVLLYRSWSKIPVYCQNIKNRNN